MNFGKTILEKSMEGFVLSTNNPKINDAGIVRTNNKKYNDLTIFNLPSDVQKQDSVKFEVVLSDRGYFYANFKEKVSRNDLNTGNDDAPKISTENRAYWYDWGEKKEREFIKKVVPVLNLEIRRNPEKDKGADGKPHPEAIDLVDDTNKCYADLKTVRTPFYMSGGEIYPKSQKRYDPTYTVTFNKNDYDNYKKNYLNKNKKCLIYFWVVWKKNKLGPYYGISVSPIKGVWVADFSKIVNYNDKYKFPLHYYKNRKNDDKNAQCGYMLDLRDTDIFDKVL